jgi:sarcosine oxidase gamma subunit
VAELRAAPRSVVLCQAEPSALDALVAPGHSAVACRTAPDEVLFVAPHDVGPDVAREAHDRLAALDPDALVLEVGDGWAAWSLSGPDARAAFAYLSALALPEDGFVQGEVAHVAAKVLARDDELLLLVPAYWRDHLRERIVQDARATEVSR